MQNRDGAAVRGIRAAPVTYCNDATTISCSRNRQTAPASRCPRPMSAGTPPYIPYGDGARNVRPRAPWTMASAYALVRDRGSYILHWCDNDQRPAAAINGAGIAESAADVGWDTSLRRWGAERASKDPMDDCACVRAGAGSLELHIGQVPAQSARTTPKIERVRAFSRRDLHQLILGWPGPIVHHPVSSSPCIMYRYTPLIF